MRIQHNIMAMSAYRNYTNNVSAMKKNLEKLSSGYKINRAGDDAAGLAISEKMRAQITGLETAQKNAKDGISLVQTAEGALTEVHDMLNRMVELATQSANGTYDNTTDRDQLQKEMDQLREEINRIADSSNFNGIKLLDGTMSLNETNPVSVANATTGKGVDKTVYGTDKNSVVGAANATNAANNPTILHTDGKDAIVGQFTLALDQLEVAAVTGTAAAVNISIGTGAGTVKVEAGADSVAMNGKDIATQLVAGGGKYVVVGSNGKAVFASTSTGLGNNALVYTGATNSDGTVTYTLKGYTTGGGTYTAIADTDALAALPASVANALKGAAGADLHFNVGAASVAGQGALQDNRQNYGTINVKNSQVKEAGTLGDASIAFDVTKLKDGDLITIGAGSQAKTMAVKLKGSDTLAKAGNVTLGSGTAAQTVAVTVLDLSAFASGSGDNVAITSANKLAATTKLATDLAGTNAGIHVGVNPAGNLTISEKTNGQGVSAANSDVTKLMENVNTFKDLVKVHAASVQPGAAATAKSTVTVENPESIYEGNTLELTINGQATKFVFTKDEAKLNATGSSVPANTKYVDLDATGGVVDALKTAIAAVAGTGVTPTLGTNGKDIILSVTAGASASTATPPVDNTASAIKWTGNAGLRLQIGDTADPYNQLKVNIKDMHTSAMGDGKTSIKDISIATQDDAADAVDVIKAAINYVSDVRGTLGATQNRLDHTINNLSVMTENIQDAESTIRDVDVAEEMMAYTKNNILIQSAQAMLAQANQVPQGVLQLLQ